uniref:Transmembrane protein n=1 Tax=Schistosoma mansoni TaxID=6183 RepID=A0A5K4F8D9_SCHMA
MYLTNFQYELLHQFKLLGQLMAPFEDGVLKDSKYKIDNNNNNNVNSIMSGSLSNRYIQNDEISRYSDEWMLGTEGSISVNSSDIYINDPMYKRQSSNHSSTNSIISTTLTNPSQIQQPLNQDQLYLSMINPSQFYTQFKVYLVFKFIVYSLVCINILLSLICLYAMDSSMIQFKSKFTDNTLKQTQNTFENVIMNEINQLSITAEEIIQSLLEAYQLSPVIKSAESISHSINETVTASEIIYVKQKTLQQDVNSYIGELRGYANILNKTLDSICETFNESTLEKVACRQLQFNNSILFINVDTKLFEFESSSILIFLINNLNINLNLITDQFDLIQNLLNNKKDEVIQNMKSSFDLNYYFNIFTSLWLLLQENIIDQLNSYLTINKQNEIHNTIKLINDLISIMSYIMIILLLLLITFLLIYYLILNLYLKYQLSIIINNNNNNNLINNLINFIDFSIPNNIYSTIRYKCQRTIINNNNNKTNYNYSLIKLLNYTQIIDFNKILYSSIIQQKINDAVNSSIDKIINMNLEEIIPSDLDSLTSIARKLSVYLDGKDYKPTIQEILHFISIQSNIINYLNEINNFQQSSKNFFNLINIIEQINKSLINYNQITKSIKPLINLFEKLEFNKNLTKQFDQIINGLNNFKNLSSDRQKLKETIRPIFNSTIQSLLNQTSLLLNYEFEQLFANILPCDNLNKILMILLNLFCDSTHSIVLCLGSFIFIISISYFLLMVTLCIFVIYSRRHIELLMYTKWENIPLYDSVKLCYNLLEYN